MSFWDRFQSVFMAQANQPLYVAIPNDRVSPAISDEAFTPDRCYMRVWLNNMYLNHKRVLYQTRVPLIHAYCRFLYWGHQEELPRLASIGQVKELGDALDRAVSLNYRLLGPVPFRGGEVELLLALIAVENANYGDMLLNVLGGLSQVTGTGELKLALQFLQPLKRGVEGLFGLQHTRPHLWMHDTFTSGENAPSRLTPGYRVVMDVTESLIDRATLWVKNGRLCQGPTLEAATPFEGRDYFLFYLERIEKRDDIPGMASIQQVWDNAIVKATGESEQELDVAFNTFKGTVLQSPDLIWQDQRDLIQLLRDRVKVIHAERNGLGFLTLTFDTSLSGAVAESRPAALGPPHLTREEIVGLGWR